MVPNKRLLGESFAASHCTIVAYSGGGIVVYSDGAMSLAGNSVEVRTLFRDKITKSKQKETLLAGSNGVTQCGQAQKDCIGGKAWSLLGHFE
jgi:hypothetical protein